MNTPARRLVATLVASLCLAGCGFLKPSGITPRTFVLTPTASAPAATATGSTNLSVGIRYVKTPGYLAKNSMAMRKDRNEIIYLDTAQWAERLDLGLQRVLAANLGTLLGTDRVRLSSWNPGEVSVEVQVGVEQFDVDNQGKAVLVAWWRVSAPEGGTVLASGRFSATHQGPSPETDPLGAAASMSALAGDLSREVARAIRPDSR